MVNDLKLECSFSSWYPTFKKDSLEARILHVPNEILKYLEHDAFVLPLEATRSLSEDSEWADGSPVTYEEEVFIIILYFDFGNDNCNLGYIC